ncbi:MAG TPA: pyridoxamine 5'-phosphate oxidase family protein [Thermotogota bacterium]|nr:pyridoxamine 5'-phosphate oxidase family protein [Thermotogota bacterium]HPJ87855.1 pyridoxamine 5'-phosphate oxidase family protein [Thermotogota bacterium]HPR94948.1 pyridoxamine 5'-phosphate oxidase family protein [Thermotogota bacterium]
MRRKDKQIGDIKYVKSIITENNLLHLGLSDSNRPYVIPLNYGYDGENLFIHCAMAGKKIDIIKNNTDEYGTPCFFEISDSIRVVTDEESCSCTTHYRCVMGSGRISIIDDSKEKLEALKLIVRHIEKREATSLPEAVVEKTCVLKITVEELTGKQSPAK